MSEDARERIAPATRISRWRDRSRGVRRLRWVLPAVMGALVLAVAGWIAVRAVMADLRSDRAAAGGLHMTNPRFFGRDEAGRAFTLQAGEAVRDARDPDRVTLTRPNLVLDYGGVRPSTVSGARGVYLQSARRLNVTGGVRVDDGRGARLNSPDAVVDTRTGDVQGSGGVTGESPLGRFQASSYLVSGKGARVAFNGGVRARLTNASNTPPTVPEPSPR